MGFAQGLGCLGLKKSNEALNSKSVMIYTQTNENGDLYSEENRGEVMGCFVSWQ